MQELKWHPKTIQVDQTNPEKLSVLVDKMEELLKPYQHTFVIRTEKKNGAVTKIRLETDINI